MKRIVALLLIWSMSANILFAVPLRRGTSVIVRLSTSANSNRDTPIRAEVVSDLTIAGEPVITRGTPVILSVNKGKAKGLGKPGYLQIGCISTTAVDGQIISLSGGIEQDGENRQTYTGRKDSQGRRHWVRCRFRSYIFTIGRILLFVSER